MCDEIYFMKEATLLKAVFPVAQQNNTCLLGTTTPSGSDHIVSQMITARDDNGDPVIATVRIGKPCDECSARRVLCTHIENSAAEGTSRKKRTKYQKLYEGREHIAMREFQGEIGDDSQQIYQSVWLRALRDKPLRPLPAHIDTLFITMDPAQGGACEWSTVGAYYDRISGEMVVVLLDSFRIQPPTPQNIREHFERSVEALASENALFAKTPIVLACECAPKNFAEALAEYALDLARRTSISITVMREMPAIRNLAGAGVPKNNSNTLHMADISKVYLENDAVAFSEACTTSCRTNGSTVETQKLKMLAQLERVKKKRKEQKDPFAPPRFRIDGKEGGQNDDYAVAFMMQPYWYAWFWRSDQESYGRVRAWSALQRGYGHAPDSTHLFSPKAYEGRINAASNKRKRTAEEAKLDDVRKRQQELLDSLL